MSREAKMLDVAIQYRKEGWYPVPIPYREKGPIVDGWQDMRLDSLEQLAEHFNGQPQNIGVILGAASGDLIDVDLDQPECLAFAKWLLPETRQFGRPGNINSHWLFRAATNITRAQFFVLLPDETRKPKQHMFVELRANRHQTVFPPSTHKESGEPIRWRDQLPLQEIDFSKLHRIAGFIAAGAALAQAWAREKGCRHSCEMALAGMLLRSGFSDQDAERFVLTIATIAKTENAAQRAKNVTVTTRQRLEQRKPVTGWRTLSKLLNQPELLKNIPGWLGYSLMWSEATEEQANKAGETEPNEPRPVQYSDDALADLFSKQHAEDFRYVDAWGWLHWAGTYWARVPDVAIMNYARVICRNQSETCKHDSTLSEKARETLARALASAKTVAAVVKLASGDPRHLRIVSQFDRNLWLFNTPGGTIDLKTGALSPHNHEDYVTKVANATPQGDCPKWLAFLRDITAGSQETQNYLQRLAGYALCGDPSEECLDFFYGTGGNGKGTFLKTLQYTFGDYSTTAATETFLETRNERHSTEVAKLAGARLVIAQEVDEGQRWNESRLKTMTGRDEMTARFMRRDFFNFTPEFTLIISGNNKPAMKTVDEAWRRRFHLVPFTVEIPKNKRNPNLKTELQAEADGILKWCVEGCLAWQKQRLNPPEAVLAATNEYFDSENTLQMWISECCLDSHKAFEERSAWLYTSYRRWTEARGERPASAKRFGGWLLKEGFKQDRQTTGARAAIFVGLRLTDDEREAVREILENRGRRVRVEGDVYN